MIRRPKKLIEVALPLEDINLASGNEKSTRHGHPSTIHPWWASRSLAAARAILFCQLVNDPGGERGWYTGKTKKEADQEREAIFDFLRELIKWENSTSETLISRARKYIEKSWRETCEINGLGVIELPEFIDPFNGRGYLPIEAQRLGLKANSSDLNPVATLIGKSVLEFPAVHLGTKPIGPLEYSTPNRATLFKIEGAEGLAEDIRRYSRYMDNIARERLRDIFPCVWEEGEKRATELNVLAWIWARTVPSPNPLAHGTPVPLITNFIISTSKGREAWVEPIVQGDSYSFIVHPGQAPPNAMKGTKKGKGSFRCLLTDTNIELSYIKKMGVDGKLGSVLVAIVAEKNGAQLYLSPNREQERIGLAYQHEWQPGESLSTHPQYMSPPRYGMCTFGSLFTQRQLAALDTLCSLLPDVKTDAMNRGASESYATAIMTYLCLAISRSADYWSTLSTWMPRGTVGHVFSTHVLPMTWDYPEANPFSNFHCSWKKSADWIAKVVERTYKDSMPGSVEQQDARSAEFNNRIISTDPPYYDNIPYSDIADYFYVWLRRGLKDVHPQLFSSILTPKNEELVADAQRWGDQANSYFLEGMVSVFERMTNQASPYFPITLYYAFKQSDTKSDKTVSRGWEAFLQAVLRAGLQITGTWPIRTERGARSRAQGSNALASSIVLVCRQREKDAPTCSRREFHRELREAMPEALTTMIGGTIGASPIAPVDLAQAAIGPGMGIYSRYSAVLNQDGTPMSVHDALVLINKEITDYLNPESGNFDADTLFCDGWFDQYGWGEGKFGEADTLARAKGTSVAGVVEAGVALATGGKVRLLKWAEYPKDWDPLGDGRKPVWEAAHQMIRTLNQEGDQACGALLARLPEQAEPIRQLAYHLYTLCERNKWADEARAYNELITSWHAIVTASQDTGHAGVQTDMLGEI